MFNASDARKSADENKATVSQTDLLINHLDQLIKKASNQGKYEIDKQTFAADRFSAVVVDDVMRKLQDHGYKVVLSKHNALNQIIFTITW